MKSTLVLEWVLDNSHYCSFNFHYISESYFVFLCVAEADVGIRIPFAFLGDIQNRFFTTFGQKTPVANINYGEAFGRTLQDKMLYFSEDPSADKVNRVKKEIDEVKVVMERNIEKVLDRGEKIEILLSKTEDLSYSSFDFKSIASLCTEQFINCFRKCYTSKTEDVVEKQSCMCNIGYYITGMLLVGLYFIYFGKIIAGLATFGILISKKIITF